MTSLVVGGEVGRRKGRAGLGVGGVSGLVGVFRTWNKETRSSSDETSSSLENDERNIE
jgi:hypothetical protein